MKKYITLRKQGKKMRLDRNSIWLYTDPRNGINVRWLSFGKVDGVEFGYKELVEALEREQKKGG